MPGLFGGVGCRPDVYEALRSAFSAPWDGCEFVRIGEGALGGHAFKPALALHALRSGVHFAVDGEAAIYPLAQGFARGTGEPLFHISSGGLETTRACRGNVAVLDPSSTAGTPQG